jgi:FixJ family two-component response regulator
MLTGHSEKETIVDCKAAGAADFVVKPFERELLLKKIDRILGRPGLVAAP